MTAEIALMNKQCVALAADSAVTLSGESGPKIFSSANKIFALSKYAPVGVMIYGDAEILRTPWEIVVKSYRQHLGRSCFDSLEQYADHFIDYLGHSAELFPQAEPHEYFLANVRGFFTFLRDQIVQRAEAEMGRGVTVDPARVSAIAHDVIADAWTKWEASPLLPGLPEDHFTTLDRTLGRLIEAERRNIFEELQLTDEDTQRLRDLGGWLTSKFLATLPAGGTGLVIAGFGERDTFPVLWACRIHGVMHNQVQREEPDVTHISREMDALIAPYAQSEMVHAFMRGTHPNIDAFIGGSLERVFSEYPAIVAEALGQKKPAAAARRRLAQISDAMLSDFFEGLDRYRADHQVKPTIDIVGSLPKDELAAMAESLVNLTSFRRRVSMDAETVGGPIDVAVISKGDGFIWIKRKHYFDPSLNPQFFATYNG